MKLDGEKLLADLNKSLEFSQKLIKKISGDDIYMANHIGKVDELEAIISSIKSGDYTVDCNK